MSEAKNNRASKRGYTSPNQLHIPGFETPFTQNLLPDNRWVVLARKIPWDALVGVYQNQMHNAQTGADGINLRIAIGAIIIKHMCALSDRETILQIQENMYMQYFIGYSSYSNDAPFDPSLFVELRKRLGADTVNIINEKILGLSEGGSIGREPLPGIPDTEKREQQDSGLPAAIERDAKAGKLPEGIAPVTDCGSAGSHCLPGDTASTGVTIALAAASDIIAGTIRAK
jgi:hypothetical protein